MIQYNTVDVQVAKSKLGQTYEKGCSGFVCDVLGKTYQTTKSFKKGPSIGINGKDGNIPPGTVVGFEGHVAIYLGEPNAKFIDCPG